VQRFSFLSSEELFLQAIKFSAKHSRAPLQSSGRGVHMRGFMGANLYPQSVWYDRIWTQHMEFAVPGDSWSSLWLGVQKKLISLQRYFACNKPCVVLRLFTTNPLWVVRIKFKERARADLLRKEPYILMILYTPRRKLRSGVHWHDKFICGLCKFNAIPREDDVLETPFLRQVRLFTPKDIAQIYQFFICSRNHLSLFPPDTYPLFLY